MRSKVRVHRKDTLRPLVTEVLPAETPIIFSNDGFYLRAIKNQCSAGAEETTFNHIVRHDCDGGKRPWYVPYSYRIKKSALQFRTLSVMHPAAQWSAKDFYTRFGPLILHYTKRSSFSIRAPADYAKFYFVPGAATGNERFKKGAVAEHGVDSFLSHSPSYFSYSGHSRLYKFFDSTEFIDLEARHTTLWMIDVSKCFDSIYTHTISWAVKERSFAKQNIRAKYFGDEFDTLMQSMNHGETAGILIGPELSRIFAELILQEIDARIERNLRSRGLEVGIDYDIRRYVDDFLVFARDSDAAGVVYASICEELAYFKLGVNESKIRKYSRPFLTEKSKTIIEVSQAINELTRTIASESKSDDANYLTPRKIYRPERLALSFCNEVKICCAANNCEYEEVSGYVISSLKNRAIRIMDSIGSKDSGEPEWYAGALAVILRVILFLFSVAPSVTASYRLCAAILLIARFSEKSIPDQSSEIKGLIFNEASSVLARSSERQPVDRFIDLESQNLLLAISDLGADYRLDPEVISALFCRDPKTSSYFNLVTLLYYIKDDPRYVAPRKWAMEVAESMLTDLSDIRLSAEQSLLFLDLVSCPYVDNARRQDWVRRFLSTVNEPQALASKVLSDAESHHWFVNWREIDLMNLLARKELQSVY